MGSITYGVSKAASKYMFVAGPYSRPNKGFPQLFILQSF